MAPVPEPGPFVTRPVLPIGRDLEVAQDAIDGRTGEGEGAAVRSDPCAMVGSLCRRSNWTIIKVSKWM